MIFNTDPIFRARVWQGIARLTLGLIACYNALLGLTGPTSLTARAVGDDALVDYFQVGQICFGLWIAIQAIDQGIRQSWHAPIPFGACMLSMLMQTWLVIGAGMSPLLASYYLWLVCLFGAGALAAATNSAAVARARCQ